MRSKVQYTCDYVSEDTNTQRGRIIVEPDSGGKIVATWRADGGMGGGADLHSNTTEWTDDQAGDLLDNPDLCQGIGTFYADITPNGKWFDIDNIKWEES